MPADGPGSMVYGGDHPCLICHQHHRVSSDEAVEGVARALIALVRRRVPSVGGSKTLAVIKIQHKGRNQFLATLSGDAAFQPSHDEQVRIRAEHGLLDQGEEVPPRDPNATLPNFLDLQSEINANENLRNVVLISTDRVWANPAFRFTVPAGKRDRFPFPHPGEPQYRYGEQQALSRRTVLHVGEPPRSLGGRDLRQVAIDRRSDDPRLFEFLRCLNAPNGAFYGHYCALPKLLRYLAGSCDTPEGYTGDALQSMRAVEFLIDNSRDPREACHVCQHWVPTLLCLCRPATAAT